MNLTEQLESLTLDQVDKLLERLKEKNYLVPPRNAIQGIVGLIKYQDEWHIHFVDRILEVDSFQVRVEDLQYNIKNDIINAINDIL